MERSQGEGSSPSPMDQPSAPSDPPDQPPAAHAKLDPDSGLPPAGPGARSEALAVLTSFVRRLLVLVPVYLAGAAGLSVGFVVFGLALYLGWRRVRDEKERSLRAARQLLDDEERLTAKTLYLSQRELPAWVSHPTRPTASRGPLSGFAPHRGTVSPASRPGRATLGPAVQHSSPTPAARQD